MAAAGAADKAASAQRKLSKHTMQELPKIAQISFEGAYEDPSPFVTIYNPKVLPAALASQVQRFGLVGARQKKPFLSGHLKGSRRAFTEMIQTYGVTVEVVPVRL